MSKVGDSGASSQSRKTKLRDQPASDPSMSEDVSEVHNISN